MPIRQGDRLASRASTWPRDHFCCSTISPRLSCPTRWNEFLPISMPTTAIALLSLCDMACSLILAPPGQLRWLAGLEHGRTIPLPDMSGPLLLRCTASTCYTRIALGSSRCSGASSVDCSAATPPRLLHWPSKKSELGEEPCARSVLFCSVSQ